VRALWGGAAHGKKTGYIARLPGERGNAEKGTETQKRTGSKQEGLSTQVGMGVGCVVRRRPRRKKGGQPTLKGLRKEKAWGVRPGIGERQ